MGEKSREGLIMPLKWDATKEELQTISKIMTRIELAGHTINRPTLAMDIEACHCNGCPLKLADLANAPLGDLTHDVFGISRNIDRTTGKLKNCFVPRYAA
jgi:hypothetical protein